MNANLNMNSYRTNAYQSSNDIRRAYLANTRKNEITSYINKALSNPAVFSFIFALKVVCAIACAIAFFVVIGLTESGEMTALSGIFSAVAIALVECICFIPIGDKSRYYKN